MQVFSSRKMGMMVLAVAVVFACLYGPYRTLTAYYNETQRVFTQGEQGDGYSIQGDLDRRLEESYNLLSIAQKYPSVDTALVAQVNAQRQDLTGATTPHTKFTANEKLSQGVQMLYQAMGSLPLSEQDERYRTRIYTNFTSANDIIAKDPYNQYATAYNEKRSAFPGGILASFTGVPKAELFA